MYADPIREYPFCSNPDCVLYVIASATNVVGWGNWAELSDGRVIGRCVYFGIFLCDGCHREWTAVHDFVPIDLTMHTA